MNQGIHKGHRERMRNKLIRFGSDIFTDHELLEMLLYSVIPYRNTNPVAINLINRFSGLSGVLSASLEELMEVDGIGECAARLILSVGAIRIDDTSLADIKPLKRCDSYKSTAQSIFDFFDGIKGYHTALMLFNNSLELIKTQIMTDTDYSSAAVKPREFIDTALLNSASVAMVVHTHPYGPNIPSAGDLETNTLIRESLASVGVMLLESFIHSGGEVIATMKLNKDDFPEGSAIASFLGSREEK